MPLRNADGEVVYGGSYLDDSTTELLKSVIDDLQQQISAVLTERNLPAGFVRTSSPCVTYAMINSTDIFFLAQKSDAITSTIYMPINEGDITLQQVMSYGRWHQGLEDAFALHIPRLAVDSEEPKSREQTIRAVAQQFVEQEYQRVMRQEQLIQVSPIFGPASFTIQEQQCFVMMPFHDDFRGIYDFHIKKVVESQGFVCKRVDDFHGPRAIMRDVWKLICESKLLIADLTGANANVFYELGIAHTVGKSPILLIQRGDALKFDISHYRHIYYDNNAEGLAALDTGLQRAIEEQLDPNLA